MCMCCNQITPTEKMSQILKYHFANWAHNKKSAGIVLPHSLLNFKAAVVLCILTAAPGHRVLNVGHIRRGIAHIVHEVHTM